MTQDPILSVRGLQIRFGLRGRTLHAIRDIDLDLYRGEVLALVGESGSGKSVFTKSFMGLLDANGSITGGSIDYYPTPGCAPLHLAALKTEKEWLTVRGREIAMVMQDPMTSLNPLKTIGEQITEAVTLHQGLKGAAAREKTLEYLRDVGISDPALRYKQYPHEFSGGMRQRVVIAIALACNPKILLCDEPTTALDVTTQASILKLILELQKKNGTAVLFITHDFGVVSEIADQVVVLELGKQIETGPANAVLQHPKEPYTQKLINAVPELKPRRRPPVDGNPTLLEAKNVVKTYTLGGFFTGRVKVRALKGVSVRLRRGETIGIVGESGSGKSTFARSIARLIDPTSGEVWVNGENVAAAPKRKLHGLRRRLQVVFQNPYRSLDPRMTVGESIVEGPVNFGVPKEEAWKRAQEFMKIVRLSPDALNRYPNQFSGGQRQRISIARALACEPEILICDEAVSALDVSVQDRKSVV